MTQVLYTVDWLGFFQDPKMYVQTILNVNRKYHAQVMTAFSNDAGFVAALDKVRTDNICQNFEYALLWNHSYWCGPMFMDFQNFASAVVTYFRK